VVITRSPQGIPHIAPMGMRENEGLVVLAPFRPSATLDNLEATRCVVVNMTDDVSIIAGCLTGRRDWPTIPVERVQGTRLANALAHLECEVERIKEDPERPRFYCRVVHQETHAPFKGFNRAQAAVLEAAILVSRLHMLPQKKIDQELQYLAIAIEKTAGEREKLAWGWLLEAIDAHRKNNSDTWETTA